MPYGYSVYGIHLTSNIPLQGLTESSADPGARLFAHFEVVSPWSLRNEAWERLRYATPHAPDETPALEVRESDDGEAVLLRYADHTEFVVDAAGVNVWVKTPAAATLADTLTYFLGPVLGFMLRLHGRTCLHASVVEIGGCAVAFAGAAGAGKSTIAAAFAMNGAAVLSDDVAVLRETSTGFSIESAYPRVRLWPESVSALFGDAEALPRITPTWEKRHLDLTAGGTRFSAAELPLGAIYFIERYPGSGALDIAVVDARSALVRLISHGYGSRLLDADMRARELELLGRVASGVPVRALCVPDDALRLAEVCDRVRGDLAAFPRGPARV